MVVFHHMKNNEYAGGVVCLTEAAEADMQKHNFN